MKNLFEVGDRVVFTESAYVNDYDYIGKVTNIEKSEVTFSPYSKTLQFKSGSPFEIGTTIYGDFSTLACKYARCLGFDLSYFNKNKIEIFIHESMCFDSPDDLIPIYSTILDDGLYIRKYHQCEYEVLYNKNGVTVRAKQVRDKWESIVQYIGSYQNCWDRFKIDQDDLSLVNPRFSEISKLEFLNNGFQFRLERCDMSYLRKSFRTLR